MQITIKKEHIEALNKIVEEENSKTFFHITPSMIVNGMIEKEIKEYFKSKKKIKASKIPSVLRENNNEKK